MKTMHPVLRPTACILLGLVAVTFPSVNAARAQAPAAATQSQNVITSSTTTASGTESNNEVVQMDAFNVNSVRDYGYLRTNAATASRVGMEIQKAPMSISVMSSDFIQDTNLHSVTDVLRYVASGSPDNSFAMRRPANEATPQGNFTMRGFTVNSLMRDGVFRYTAYNLDNVERVEIVKGPAAVFFGQGYPGGVINYITKKPVFAKTPSTVSYGIDDNGSKKFTYDLNQYISPKAAIRVVGAWTDFEGDRNFEYENNFNITPSISFIPFKSQILRINLDYEYIRKQFNYNSNDWIYPSQWFKDYQNPSQALMDAAGVTTVDAYRARIFNSVGNWIADVRKATNNPGLPTYTSIDRGAYYMNADGQRVHDSNFNYTSRGASATDKVGTLTGTVEFYPVSWLDARYVFTHEDAKYNGIESTIIPNADGMTFNAANGPNYGGYWRTTDNHQLDLIFKKDFLGLKNKLLVGGSHISDTQHYATPMPGLYYASTPGATNPAANQYLDANGNTVLLVPTQFQSTTAIPVNQVLYNRAGNILRVDQVYSQWDPGVNVEPEVSRIIQQPSPVVDGYPGDTDALYLNLQTTALDDKLTFFAGYRWEWLKNKGQALQANYPYSIAPPSAFLDQTQWPPGVYNYDPTYAADIGNWQTLHGSSWMLGISYEVVKGVNVYASVSKTFKFNSGLAGGYSVLDLPNLIKAALANGNGSFQYRGKTINNLQEGLDAVAATGAGQNISNEVGMNYEIGVKTDLADGKFFATFSLFQGDRKNQKLDDGNAQSNANEPFNYSTTLFAPTDKYYNTRNFRWRSVGVHNRVQGFEYELTWTPIRNWQTVFNGSWLFTAKTIDDPRYIKGSGVTADIIYGSRIANVPEYRVNLVSKYTFDEGAVHGLSITGMMRYASKTVIAQTIDYNPLNGGLTGGNYVVFDIRVSYPFEVHGQRFSVDAGLYNIFDSEYLEGQGALSPGRLFSLTLSTSF